MVLCQEWGRHLDCIRFVVCHSLLDETQGTHIGLAAENNEPMCDAVAGVSGANVFVRNYAICPTVSGLCGERFELF